MLNAVVAFKLAESEVLIGIVIKVTIVDQVLVEALCMGEGCQALA